MSELNNKFNVGIIAGSVRKESFSKKIAKAVSDLLPENCHSKMIDIGSLAMYNQDLDDEKRTPHEWLAFREEVKTKDAFLFVTPEYNRSLPPVLKNALDVASRPYGENVWSGKAGAVISVSIGKLTGFGANHHLRQALVFLNVPIMQQPELYIGEAASIMDDKGNITNPDSKKILENFAVSFAAWIKKIKA